MLQFLYVLLSLFSKIVQYNYDIVALVRLLLIDCQKW